MPGKKEVEIPEGLVYNRENVTFEARLEDKPMLFRKKIDPSCAYCIHGTALDDTQLLCAKKGLRPLPGSCRRFRYDPCKRIPSKMKAPDFSKYEAEDYSL